jgi:hypothetical protein
MAKKPKTARAAVGAWAQQLGTLRLLLMGCALLVIVSIPAPGVAVGYTGAKLVTTVLVPVMAPILFMVLLLDALMARVFMSEAPPAERRRLTTIAGLHLALALLLMVRWLPYFLGLRG